MMVEIERFKSRKDITFLLCCVVASPQVPFCDSELGTEQFFNCADVVITSGGNNVGERQIQYPYTGMHTTHSTKVLFLCEPEELKGVNYPDPCLDWLLPPAANG